MHRIIPIKVTGKNMLKDVQMKATLFHIQAFLNGKWVTTNYYV